MPADGEPIGARRGLRLRAQPGRRLERACSTRWTAHLDEFALLPREERSAPAPPPAFALSARPGRDARPAHGRAACGASRRRPTIRPSPPSRSRAATSTRWVDARDRATASAAFADARAGARRRCRRTARADAAALLERARGDRRAARRRCASSTPSGLKTRIHGDYHLGQVLVAQDDVMIIDFEGEPQREPRRAAREDLAAARRRRHAALLRLRRLGGARPAARAPAASCEPHVRERAFAWRDAAAQTFLDGYWARAARAGLLPEDIGGAAAACCELFLFQKAFYEIGYEAANRPGLAVDPGPRRARPDRVRKRGDAMKRCRRAERTAWRPDDGGDRRARRRPARRSVRRARHARARRRAALGARLLAGRRGRRRARREDRRSVARAARSCIPTASSPARSPRRRKPFPYRLRFTRRRRRPGRRTTPTASRRCSASSTSICWRRAAIAASTSGSARIPCSIEGVDGVAFAVWAPNAQPRQRGRRLQRLGRPPPPDAQARRGRRLGALRPRRRPTARSTSTSCSAPTARCCR